MNIDFIAWIISWKQVEKPLAKSLSSDTFLASDRVDVISGYLDSGVTVGVELIDVFEPTASQKDAFATLPEVVFSDSEGFPEKLWELLWFSWS